MRLKLIACEVLYREMCAAVARAPHQVDIEFLPKGLHDLGGAAMRARLQEIVDAADPARYEALLLGYALCGNGVAGLRSRALPLVIPRAHDCIALLMGSRQRYQEYFDNTPGVYFRSTGWLERGEHLDQATCASCATAPAAATPSKTSSPATAKTTADTCSSNSAAISARIAA